MKTTERKKGQSIVEMALLFPLFLLIVVGGIIDFGFAFYNVVALQQLASDAASSASENVATRLSRINPSNEALRNQASVKQTVDQDTLNYIYNYSSPPINWHEAGIYNAVTEWLPMTDGSQMVRVSLEYRSKTYTPFYQTFVNAATGSDSITLRTQAVFKVPKNLNKR